MSKNIGTLVNSALAYSQRAQSSRMIGSWSQETAEEYQTATARLLAQVQALAAKEKTENANPNHSPTGLLAAMKTAVNDFITNLRWMRDLKGSLETKVGNLYGNLFILKPSTRPDQPARYTFIWGVISQMTPGERDNQYLRSSEIDQTEILHAIQDAPFPLVMDEVRMRGDDERVARLQPDRYRKFIENGQLLDEISTILQDALGLGLEFGLDVPPSVDELGPKIRTALDFAIQHQGGKGKRVLRTTPKDAAPGV